MKLQQKAFEHLFYVYCDYTCESTPRPFYVGKGRWSRVRSNKERNQRHTEIVNQFGQQRRVLIMTGDEQIAFDYERYFVALFRTNSLRDGHWGANLTDGGQGWSAVPKSAAWRAKQSLAQRGRPKSDEARAKMSMARRGRKITHQHYLKMVAGKRPFVPSPMKGKRRSPEAVAKGWETRRRNKGSNVVA